MAEMEAESSVIRFVQDFPGGHVHSGSISQVIPGGGMIRPSMGALMAGFGMAPTAGIFLPGRPPASGIYSAGANASRNVWNGMVMAGKAGNVNGTRAPPVQQKGPWTVEEDDVLKDMVREHGDRKWALIARFLPGRIGKQCRERWTNHLRPDIKKSQWTEEDDLALIEAHKTYGNRWSMIARYLPGRSENAVKNHWNATRRSLKAKRRLKKKRNADAPAGRQLTVLEEYIRSLYPADFAAVAPLLVSPPSSSYNVGYGEVASPPPATTGGLGFNPEAGMGMMYLNNSGGGTSPSVSPQSSDAGAAMNNMNAPPSMPLLDLNTYYGDMAPPLNSQVMMDHDPQQQQASSYANMVMMNYQQPFADNFMWQPSSVAQAIAGGANNNANNSTAGDHQYYYGGGGGGGPSSGRDTGIIADDVDVVQMASREFLTPSQDEVTLDLARFM